MVGYFPCSSPIFTLHSPYFDRYAFPAFLNTYSGFRFHMVALDILSFFSKYRREYGDCYGYKNGLLYEGGKKGNKKRKNVRNLSAAVKAATVVEDMKSRRQKTRKEVNGGIVFFGFLVLPRGWWMIVSCWGSCGPLLLAWAVSFGVTGELPLTGGQFAITFGFSNNEASWK